MTKYSDVTVRLSAEGQEQLLAALRSIGPEGEKMARRLERAGQDASRGLLAINAAAGEVKGAAQGLASRLGPAGSALMAVGTGGLAAAAGLGAVALAAGKAFEQARKGMEFADGLLTASERLHIGVERLQEYRAALRLVGDATADFDAGLTMLLSSMGELDRTGGGKAAGAFKALGLSVRDANGQMKSGEQMLAEIIEKMSALDSAAQRADISKKLFGPQAANFLALIQQGGDGVARLRDEMRALGVVMDGDVVRRFAEAEQKSKLLAQAVDTQLMEAFVDLGPVLVSTSGLLAGLARGLSDVMDSFRNFENRTSRGLETRLAGLLEERNRLEVTLNRAPRWSPQEKTDALAFWGDAPVEKIKARIAEIDAKAASIQDILAGRRQREKPAGADSGDGVLPSGLDDAVRRDIEALEQMRRSTETFGNARQQAIDAAVSRLSKDASPAQREEMAALAAQIYDMTEAQRDLNRELEDEIKIRNEGKQVLESVMTDQERYEAQSARLKDLLAAGAITQETYNRALQKAREEYDPATRAVKEMSEGIADASIELMSSIGSFHDAGEAARDFAQKILQLILQIVAWQPIQSAMSSWLTGMFTGGASSGSIFHGGGMAGESAPSRAISGGLLAAAPRFHTGGLLPGEVPVIARRGEGIFTPRQMDNADALFRGMAAMAGGRGRGDVTVNIMQGQGVKADVKQRRAADGGVTVDVMLRQVQEQIAGDVSAGRSPINMALERRYTLNPAAGLHR